MSNEENGTDDEPGVGKLLLLIIPPVIAVLALVFAFIGLAGVRSMRLELADTHAALQKRSTELKNVQFELAQLKSSMLKQQKAMQQAGNDKQDVLNARFVDSISQLQTRLRIRPTLANQIAPNAATPAATKGGASGPHNNPRIDALINAIKTFNKQQ